MDATVLGVIAVGAVLIVLYLKFGKGSKSANAALSEREYRKFRLRSKTDVNHNSTLFRFDLPSPDMRLGLPVGTHCLLRGEEENGGAPFSRAYTPVSSDDDAGHFDLLVKIYPEGKMGQYLKKLPVGSFVEAKGPLGEIRYHGQGKFAIARKNEKTRLREEQKVTVRRIGMIAGGSGITPMLQLMRTISKDAQDGTEISLIYANVEERDILLREELDRLASEHKNIKVFYTLDKPPAGWNYGSGFVSAEMMKDNLPAPGKDTLILRCGPPMMMKFLEKNLAALDYPESQCFAY